MTGVRLPFRSRGAFGACSGRVPRVGARRAHADPGGGQAPRRTGCATQEGSHLPC